MNTCTIETGEKISYALLHEARRREAPRELVCDEESRWPRS